MNFEFTKLYYVSGQIGEIALIITWHSVAERQKAALQSNDAEDKNKQQKNGNITKTMHG